MFLLQAGSYLAMFRWNPRSPRGRLSELKKDSELRKLLSGWGERDGDTAVIAVAKGRRIGAGRSGSRSEPQCRPGQLCIESLRERGISTDR